MHIARTFPSTTTSMEYLSLPAVTSIFRFFPKFNQLERIGSHFFAAHEGVAAVTLKTRPTDQGRPMLINLVLRATSFTGQDSHRFPRRFTSSVINTALNTRTALSLRSKSTSTVASAQFVETMAPGSRGCFEQL